MPIKFGQKPDKRMPYPNSLDLKNNKASQFEMSADERNAEKRLAAPAESEPVRFSLGLNQLLSPIGTGTRHGRRYRPVSKDRVVLVS